MHDLALGPPLVCPTCLGPLTPAGAAARCAACAREVATWSEGHPPILDFIRRDDPGARGLGPRLMHSRLLARVYQRYWRPLFVAVAGGRLHDLEEELGVVGRALAPARAGVVLDLSCGPGHTARHLARAGDFSRVFGVDWSIAMLRECAAACRAERTDLDLVRADVARLPFATASVAGVHAGAALHVWPDPAAAAAEIGRVLRDGGAFIASTFAHHRSPLIRRAEAIFEQLSDARVFHEEELRGIFEAHGLTDLEVHRRGSLILLWGRRRARGAGADAGR